MPQCSSDACGQDSRRCPTRQACGLPENRTFETTYELDGPHRRESTDLRPTDYLVLAFVLAIVFFSILHHYGVFQ